MFMAFKKIIALFVVTAFAVVVMGACGEDPKRAVNHDPVAEDFVINGHLAIYDGTAKTISITPKAGKSTGQRTTFYEGTSPTIYAKSATGPSAVGSYTVTFNIAAVQGFNEALGLSAGTLVISPKTDDPDDPIDPFDPVEPDTPWVDGSVTVDIFSFNDFHGTMDSSASAANPGAARFTAIAKHLMGQSPHSMLLAAGDNYQHIKYYPFGQHRQPCRYHLLSGNLAPKKGGCPKRAAPLYLD